MAFDAVTHRPVERDVVSVSTPLAVTRDAAGRLEILDDPLYGALRDANRVGEIAQPEPRGSRVRQISTCVWFVRNVHVPSSIGSFIGFILRNRLHEIIFTRLWLGRPPFRR